MKKILKLTLLGRDARFEHDDKHDGNHDCNEYGDREWWELTIYAV
jgi:hypothetical protein